MMKLLDLANGGRLLRRVAGQAFGQPRQPRQPRQAAKAGRQAGRQACTKTGTRGRLGSASERVKGWGAVWAKSCHSAQNCHRRLLARLGYGRGQKGNTRVLEAEPGRAKVFAVTEFGACGPD